MAQSGRLGLKQDLSQELVTFSLAQLVFINILFNVYFQTVSKEHLRVPKYYKVYKEQ